MRPTGRIGDNRFVRSVILCEPGRLKVEDREIPEPGPGELVVRVRCATTCGTDLKAYVRGHPLIPMPGPFGHEYSGEIAKAGPGVNSFAEGDAVMGVHSAPCGDCFWCSHDQENLCVDATRSMVLGSFAEYLLLPARIALKNLYPKPPEVSFQRAALLEPLACVANALARLRPQPADRTLIVGSGAIALLFHAALAYSGAPQVWIAARNSKTLEALAAHGIHAFPAAKIEQKAAKETDGRGFDIVIECAGNIPAWQSALGAVRRGGTVALFGGCPAGSKVELDAARLHYDDLRVISPFHYDTEAVRTAREWLLDPGFDPGPLITSEARLEDAPAVFEELRRGRGIKVAFMP